MKKILVAFDGSESSLRALQFALDQMQAWPAVELHVLNVQEWPPAYSEYMTPALITQLHESQMTFARKALEPAVARIASAKRACQTHVLLGQIANSIVEQAETLGCDHIVMGSRGLGALKGLLVGSVATRVIHQARVPVTLVK